MNAPFQKVVRNKNKTLKRSVRRIAVVTGLLWAATVCLAPCMRGQGVSANAHERKTTLTVSASFAAAPVTPPNFSQARGFYDTPFLLSLTSDPGTQIRYTPWTELFQPTRPEQFTVGQSPSRRLRWCVRSRTILPARR